MKLLLISLLVLTPFVFGEHPVNHELVETINASGSTWTAMAPEDNPFYFVPEEQIKSMMGAKLTVYEENTDVVAANDIPTSFDSRTQWGSKVHAIRNQGQCGSCWAFGATEAFSDRLAISGKADVVLSPQHLVSCDSGNYGCNGGYLNVAWNFMHSTGVVEDTCYPYTSGSAGETGSCASSCTGSGSWTTHHSASTSTTSSVSKTQTAIMTSGPVEAAFTVYQDFMSYSSGIYQHTTGSMLGGHAIKAVGWGTEGGVDYWIMANSWGTSWGESGFFKIKRGDCGINDQMTFSEATD